MPFGEAVQHFSLLTVGDGLARADPGAADLGRDRHHRHPLGLRRRTSAPTSPARSSTSARRRWSPASVICAFALVPGLPKLPFLLIGGAVLRASAGRCATAAARRPSATRPPQAAAPPTPQGDAARAARRRARRARARPARAGDRLRPRAAGRPAAPAARCSPASASIRRQIAAELGMVIPPVRIHDDVGLDSHEYVVQGARHRGRARRRHGRPPARDGPGRRRRPAARHPDDRAGLRPARGLDRRRRARRGRGARLHGRRRRVGRSSRTSPRRSARHAAELLTRQETRQLLDQLKETNAAVVEEVVPDVLVARRDPARAAGAAARGRLDPRPRRDRRGDRRQGAALTRDPALLAEYARQALGRTITAPLPRRRAARCARSRSTRRSSRRSPSRSRRPPTASSWRWTRRARRRSSRALPSQVEHARRARAAARCCCARRACAATCAGSVEQALPQLPVCSYNEIAPGISVETIGVVDA